MFDSWTQWHWVAFAWGQVILAYIGYGVYLYRQGKQLKTTRTEHDESKG